MTRPLITKVHCSQSQFTVQKSKEYSMAVGRRNNFRSSRQKTQCRLVSIYIASQFGLSVWSNTGPEIWSPGRLPSERWETDAEMIIGRQSEGLTIWGSVNLLTLTLNLILTLTLTLTRTLGLSDPRIIGPSDYRYITAEIRISRKIRNPTCDGQLQTRYVHILYWQIATERTGGQFTLIQLELASEMQQGVCIPVRDRVRVRIRVSGWQNIVAYARL